MSKKRRRRTRRPKKPATSGLPRRAPRLVTPEGDPMVYASALYRHEALDQVLELLRAADDFDWEGALDGKGPELAADDFLQVIWLETGEDAEPPPDPLSRRILATLTLTPTSLKVETISWRRRRACRRRLRELLGDRIELVGTRTRSAEQMRREPAPQPEPEPLEVSPEFIAEMEERMIRQWLDESIPALGGQTPREAAKTPEGRRRLEALFDYMARDQEERELPPGMFSPDYGKAKRMLGLE